VRISYGKLRVPVHRVIRDEDPPLLACEVDVEVLGDNFRPAYTEGDNRSVVATDTMKNLILRQALAYAGPTLEGFLAHLGREFLETYAVMEAVRLTGRELRFDRLSPVLLSRSHDDRGEATLAFARTGDGVTITEHRCARVGMELLKVTGSAFTRFVRDEYTTLPERVDRPLFIRLDVGWRYGDVADALAPERHVSPAAVRAFVAEVFDAFVSESIQHLVHEMGRRLLDRFPQLAEVSFRAENLTRDPVGEQDGRRVYTDPFPAQGLITLTLCR